MPNSGSDLGIYALCTEVGSGTLGTTGGYTYGKDIGSPLTKNKSIFLNYHDDDQRVGSQHYWGCPMSGASVVGSNHVRSPDGIGLFVNWKMSGVAYNNYADSRVGSRLSKN